MIRIDIIGIKLSGWEKHIVGRHRPRWELR